MYQWLSVHKSEACYIDFWSSRQENWVASRNVQWPWWHTEMQRETVGEKKKWQKNYRRYKVWQKVKQITEITCLSFFQSIGITLGPSSSRLGAISVLPLLFPVSYSCSALHAKQDAAEIKKKKRKKRRRMYRRNKNESGRRRCSCSHLGVPSIILSLWHWVCVFFFFFFLTPLPPSLPLFLACHVCSAYPCFIYRSLH